MLYEQLYMSLLEMNASAKIPGDWTSLIPKPPSDTSSQTKRELNEVRKLANNRTKKDLELIKRVDQDPAITLKDILKEHGLTFPTPEFSKLFKILEPIILELKRSFNRTRPYDLDKSINYVPAKSHRFKAYPSGHVAYAALAEKILSMKYPEHSSKFKSAVKDVGMARMLMGVHYHSDNVAGQQLVDELWPALKKEL